MNRFLLGVIFILLAGINTKAQNWNRLQMLDHEAEYYIMARLYKDAADNFIQILKELPDNSNLKFRIGYCYLHAEGHNQDAIPFLLEASENIALDANTGVLREDRAPPEALLFLGVAYQRELKFDLAAEMYIKFREMLPEDDTRRKLAAQHLRSIEHAKIFLEIPRGIIRENLGNTINSREADINAVISGDGRTMAFTRISRRGFEVFVSRRQGDNWGRPVSINRDLRMDFLLTTGISDDGTVLYLVYHVPDMSNIYTSTFDRGSWSRARSIGRPVNSRNSETHASVSPDGKTLYFTSDRPGGYGGLDIYRASLDNRGRWSEIENLGPEINTFFNEDTPFVTVGGRYLYFSSEGHNTMGGYDVFFADLENLSLVYNPGYPVNDLYDNLFYFPLEDGRSGYISYHDREGIGRRDLFLVHADELDLSDVFLSATLDIADAETVRPSEIFTEGDTIDLFVLNELAADDYSWIEPEDYEEEEFPVPAHSREASTYSVQFLSTKEVVTAEYVDTLPDVVIHYDSDGLTRFLTGYYSTIEEARIVLKHYRENGYPDAFIRINNFIPNYTVQVKAMRKFLERSYFRHIDEIICRQGQDGLYRYSYLYFTTWYEAVHHLKRFKEMGYEDVFINRPVWDNPNRTPVLLP